MRQLNFSILTQLDGRIGYRPKIAAFVAMTIALIAGASALQTETYSTAPGEWRTITLQDGTVTRLGPKTTIVVRYTAEQRTIEQAPCQGEATYQVAQDITRPFFVECGVTTVQAMGTKFGVASHGHVTKVTVAEGAATVSRRPTRRGQPAPPDNVRAELDQQVVVEPNTPLTVRPVNAAQELAWEHAEIFFKGVQVEEAVGEYNRRHEAQIPVPTYTSNNFRVFGKFQLDNPAQFMRFIEQNLAQQRARPK
ncbi:MAG TPA: FecR domain-containing protein [Steroidobacter sp.]|uniref:FecR family protein n=1 Tax=Steroidobacter sp. TaxID=1978227 RepID=UPI002EDBA5C9